MSDIADILGNEEGFDTHSVEPATGFEPLPAGWYPVQIDDANVCPTKKRDGAYLALEMTVVGDHFAGRKLWPKINLANPSQKAVEIGRRELAALGLACGMPAVKDSSEFVGKIIQVKVKVKQEDGRDPDNEVVGYKPIDGAEQSAPAPAPGTKTVAPAKSVAASSDAKPAAKAAAPATTKGVLPWMR